MEEKDKDLVRDSSLTIADALVAATGHLGLVVAWGLSKSLFGSGMRFRQKRALEWVEMVRDNPDIFSKTIVESEEFQDGFVFALEQFLRERNEKKRTILKNVFLGFAEADDKENFPLEKFTHTTSQLSLEDIATLKDVNLKRADQNYQIYGNVKDRVVNIFNLINLGILVDDTNARMGPVDAPFVRISDFGLEFVEYLGE